MDHLGSEIHPQLHWESVRVCAQTLCQNSSSRLSSTTGALGAVG